MLLAATPYGAFPDDTAEFMLGDVLVTTVLMESKPNAPFNNNPVLEDWTPAGIEAVKQKVIDGMTWWQDTLAAQYPNADHSLNFQYDFAYADEPVLTDYEPIGNISNYFRFWMYDFLDSVGYNANKGQTDGFSNDIRAFNHAQRENHDTDWAFTIFVANDAKDSDGMFPLGGSFRKAFAFPGGQFFVAPAGRPASTFAHETGHIFWARDEYWGAGSWTDHRGYYDAQNWNAANNPTPGFTQVDSLMATGTPLVNAYDDHASSPSSLEMIGWRDSDGDGILDVLDVPLTLDGSGFVDPLAGEYRFIGSSSVQTLPNLNSEGLQNDITINEVSRAQYRIDGGNWQDAASYGTYTAELDLHIPLPTSGTHTVEVHTIDDDSGVTSNVFLAHTSRAADAVLQPGINGFVWNDQDDDSQCDPGEPGLSGWMVRLVDGDGQPISLAGGVEPDDFAEGTLLNNANSQITLTAVGADAGLGGQVSARDDISASTDTKVFQNFAASDNVWTASWTPVSRQLRMDFSPYVTTVSLDAIGNSSGDYGRMEIYDSDDSLLARYTTDHLSSGEVETMTLNRATPDIAYAIAKGHMGTGVAFDNLRFGPETSTVTDALGAYALASLPAGTYNVATIAPPGEDPLSQQHTVTLGEGEAAGHYDFGGDTVAISWQNPSNPTDVTGDGMVAPLDVLTVINYINTHPDNPALPSLPSAPPPYYDVDGNGAVTAADVLQIINELNAQSAGGSGSPEGESTAEGEEAISTASYPVQLAREQTVRRAETFPSPQSPESLISGSDSWQTAADEYFRNVDSSPAPQTITQRQYSDSDDESGGLLADIFAGLSEDWEDLLETPSVFPLS